MSHRLQHYIVITLLLGCLMPGVDVRGETLAANLGRIVVAFTPLPGQPPWVAKALEQNVYKDLAGFERLVGVDSTTINTSHCRAQKIGCLLETYRSNGIHVLMKGTVSESSIRFKVYELATNSLVSKGRIPIGPSSSLVRIRLHTFRALKPFLEKGGLLDQKQFLARANIAPDIDPNSSEHNTVGFLESDKATAKIVFFAILLFFFALPFLISTTLLGSMQVKLEKTKVSTKWVLLLVGLSSAALFLQLQNTFGQHEIDLFGSTTLKMVASYFDWFFAAVGGMAWGIFILLNLRMIFPTLQGVENVRARALLPFILHWSTIALKRSLGALLLYIPSLFLIGKIGALFGIEDRFILTILVPFSGLLFYFWFAALVEYLTQYLDQQFVEGPATEGNYWHAELKRYFEGYLKRIGVDLRERTLDDALFLPGKVHGAIAYGGGFTRPRIVVDRDLLRVALSDIPTEQIEKLDNESNHFVGLQIPDMTRPQSYEEITKALAQQQPTGRSYHANVAWGQFANARSSLLSIILPSFADSAVPLFTNNRTDMGVLEELIHGKQEGYLMDGDVEYDDTNPTDKDFLFGLLLQQFGTLVRYDTLIFTFYLAWNKLRFKKKNRKSTPSSFMEANFWGRSTIIEDSFAALNFGLPHLLQYLFYQKTSDPRVLTSRANTLTLSRISQEILKRVTSKSLNDPSEQKYGYRHRIVWLSQFLERPIKLSLPSRKRRFALIGVALVSVLTCSFYVYEAVQYHSVFLQHLADEQEIINEQQREAEEKQRNIRERK